MYRYLLALERWPQDVALLLGRATAALYVWRFSDKDSTQLDALVRLAGDIGLKSDIAEKFVHGGLLGLALLLVTGLGTRFMAIAAMALFLWVNTFQNLALFALLLILVTRGAGRFAVDYLLLKR